MYQILNATDSRLYGSAIRYLCIIVTFLLLVISIYVILTSIAHIIYTTFILSLPINHIYLPSKLHDIHLRIYEITLLTNESKASYIFILHIYCMIHRDIFFHRMTYQSILFFLSFFRYIK